MMHVVGYEYAGAAHCAGCADADLRSGYIAEDTTYPGEFPPDDNGLPAFMIGPDGNLVHPLERGVDACCDRCGTPLGTESAHNHSEAA